MKYLKYYEDNTYTTDYSEILDILNKKLNPLGIIVTHDTSNISKPAFVFNLNFMCKHFSILHISTLLFASRDYARSYYPNFENQIPEMTRTITYTLPREFINKHRTVRSKYNIGKTYNNFYGRLSTKLEKFDNTVNVFGTSTNTTGKIGYIENEEDDDLKTNININMKSIILDYMEANKNHQGEVIIPQSSIDMVKYIIDNIDGKLQNELIHGIQKNNPLVYNKIKNNDTDNAAGMHDRGFDD